MLTAKNCADVGTKPVSVSVLQQHASLQDWYAIDHGSYTPLQDDGDEPMMDQVTVLQIWRHEHRPEEESTWKCVVQKQTIVSVDRERRDGCAKLSETSV